MFAFDIDYKHWSEIHYPRAHLRDTYVPRERAFHTSTVIGMQLSCYLIRAEKEVVNLPDQHLHLVGY